MHDKIMKRVAAFVATLALVFGVTFGAATPASAAASDCPNGSFCTWNDPNYSGTRWQWSVGTIRSLPNGCLNVTASANNNQSSLYNRAGLINTVLRIHDGSNCTGDSITIATGRIDAHLTNHPDIVAWGDRLTSISARAS